MSLEDAGSIVALINTQLPNLKTLEYYNSSIMIGHVMSSQFSRPFPFEFFHRSYSRGVRAIQPFVGLGDGVHTTLDMPIPMEIASIHPQVYAVLCQLRERFIGETLQSHILVRECRSVMRKYHAMALEHGYYLHITKALRPTLDEDLQFESRLTHINLSEQRLMHMQSFGNLIDFHRYSPYLLRGERGKVDVEGKVVLAAVSPRRRKTQLVLNLR